MRGSPTHSLTSRSLVAVWVAVGTNSLFPEVLLCAGLPCLLLIWKPSVFLSLASLYFCLFLCVTQVYVAVEADEYWGFFIFQNSNLKSEICIGIRGIISKLGCTEPTGPALHCFHLFLLGFSLKFFSQESWDSACLFLPSLVELLQKLRDLLSSWFYFVWAMCKINFKAPPSV